MERCPPSSSRVRIPGGYGNYPGRDPESPPPQQSDGTSGGGGGGGRRKKRAQAPWGGLFKGKEDVALPTAAWTLGAPPDGRSDEPPQQHWQQQQQQQQWQSQLESQAQTPAWAGPAASGGGGGAATSGGVGRGYGPPPPVGHVFSSPPPPRRRASPLVENAPRLTVIRRDDYGSGGGVEVGSEGGRSATGGARGAQQQQQQQQRGPVGSQVSQRSVGTTLVSAAASPSSSSSSAHGGVSRWGSWGIGRSGGITANADSGALTSNQGAERTALLASASSRAGGGSASGGSARSSVFSGEPPGAAAAAGERPRASGRGPPRSGEGFAAEGRPSPFLVARSTSSSVSSGGGKKRSTWRSPLEQSAVNPFSASFETAGGDGGGGGGDLQRENSNTWWAAETGTQSRRHLAGNVGAGGRGGTVARGGGVLSGAGQPLLRRAGAGGGYGSGWGDGGVGVGGGGEIERKMSSDKPKTAFAKGRKVDDQGHQIFYKHGVRLVEAAEIQLESLGSPATYAVFILPYLLLALALWLDMGKLDVTSRLFPPSGNACDDSGVCSWNVTGAPIHNSFLVVKGDFDFEVVDGLVTPSPSDGVATGGGGGGGGGEGDAVDGQEGAGGQRRRRGLAIEVGGGGDEEMTEGRRRGLMLPFRNRGVQQDADDDVEQLALGVALEIRGLVGGTEMWESLYSCAAQDNVQILNCHPSEMECDTSTLGRVVLDSIGIIGHHSEYAVKATILAIQGGQPIPGGGGLVARSTTFKVETESRVYSEVRSMARLPLLALTAFLLLYWMTRGFGGAGGERDPAPSAIVPERRYITMLLFGLLLWQNPVMAVEDWLLGPSFFDTGPWRWVRLCRDLCQFTGMQVMWLCWICLMDGQHFVRKRSQRSDSSFDGSATAAGVAYRQVAGEDGDASVDTKGGESAASPCFLKDDYPPHHPKSDSFIDFILPKVLYGFLSLLVGVAVMLLRHPYLARLDQVDWLNGLFELSYAMMSMVSGLLWLGWTMYFAAVAVTSGRVLRGQPFFGTRRQQLSYRVMVMQGMLVAVLFGMSVGVDIFYLVGHLLRQQVVVGASTGFTLKSMTSAAAGLSAWTGGIRQPLGKLILVSAVCYNVAYLFLPPTHSVKRLFDRMYINMERDMPPREVVRRYKDSQELSPLFCVETSCFLVEVAWQAYYDPHKVDLSDFVAPGRQDLSYLGLELVAYFNDEKHEIRAILCRGDDRLILAFRGTARMENLMTDLKFHQVPLPQLLPPGREPIEIQLPDGNSRRYSNVFSDNDAQRDSRSYSNNSTSKRNRSRNFDGGVGSGDGPSWSRSDVSRSRSPARSSATAAAPRGARRAEVARFSPARVGRGLSPTNRPAAAAAAATKTPASPGKVVSDSTPRAVEGRSAPEGGGVSRGGGEGEEAAGAAAPGGGDGGAASGVTSSLPETGATPSVAEAGGGGEGAGTDGEEQGSEGGVSRDESAAQRDKQPGAGDAADDETSTPEEAAAGTGAPAASRPKNPNDLVRLFMSESGGGSNGRAHTVGGGGDGGGGGGVVDSQSADASAPADVGSGNNSADGGNGTDDDSKDGHVDVDGDADADAQQHVPAAGDGQEEGEGHEGQHWADGSSVGGGGDSDGESKFGGDAYNNDAVGDGDDLEAAGGNFGEGDFHIDPRGDGSFTTTAARCFKAVIHRIPVARQALPRVHGGFWEAYSVLRERVLAALAAEMQDDYRPLYVTGHSLGGALASLAAYDIDKNFTLPDPTTLYTFGSPRVGNGVFARKLDSRVKHHFRLVNDGDLITALPRFFGTYKHAGCKVVVDSERYGNFIVAPTLVEQTFGAKPLASLTPHLLNQYRECLEACMEEADLEDYFSRGIGVDPTLVPEWLKGRRRRRKEDEPALL